MLSFKCQEHELPLSETKYISKARVNLNSKHQVQVGNGIIEDVILPDLSSDQRVATHMRAVEMTVRPQR